MEILKNSNKLPIENSIPTANHLTLYIQIIVAVQMSFFHDVEVLP